MTTLILFFFSVLFGLIGISLLFIHSRIVRQQQKCTSQATGKVIQIKTSSPGRMNDSPRVTYYYPVFQYTVNGYEYTITSSYGSGNPKLHPLHSYTTVYYDPASPETACIKEKNPVLSIGVIFLICAILIFFLAIFFLTTVTNSPIREINALRDYIPCQ